MKNWTHLIPVKFRNALYLGFGVLSLAQSAILAYSAAVQAPAPVWAIGGGAVLGVIGAAFGFVAAGNTDITGPAPVEPAAPAPAPVEPAPVVTDDPAKRGQPGQIWAGGDGDQ